MMTYDEFVTATEIKDCGRGKALKKIGERVRACDGPNKTIPRLVAVLTAVHAWAWLKGKKHGQNPTANFSLRLRAVKTLVQEVKQELTALGVDATTVEKAAMSYERHKIQGTSRGCSRSRKDTTSSGHSSYLPRTAASTRIPESLRRVGAMWLKR